MPPPACCFAPLRRCSLPGGTHCNNPCEPTPMLPGAGAPCPPRGLLRRGLSPPGTRLQGLVALSCYKQAGRRKQCRLPSPLPRLFASRHPCFAGWAPRSITVQHCRAMSLHCGASAVPQPWQQLRDHTCTTKPGQPAPLQPPPASTGREVLPPSQGWTLHLAAWGWVGWKAGTG